MLVCNLFILTPEGLRFKISGRPHVFSFVEDIQTFPCSCWDLRYLEQSVGSTVEESSDPSVVSVVVVVVSGVSITVPSASVVVTVPSVAVVVVVPSVLVVVVLPSVFVIVLAVVVVVGSVLVGL